MNQETERSRREVTDWLRGPGSNIVLGLLVVFVAMFILVGLGAL